jgi:WD40 repeat protein
MLTSAGGTDGYVYVWSMADYEPILLIPEATDHCTTETVSFLPGTNFLAVGGIDWMSTGGTDGVVCLWDVVQRHEVSSFFVGTPRLAVRPNGSQIAAATLTHTVCLWDVAREELTAELNGHQDLVNCLAYAHDGTLLATGGEDGTVHLWDPDSGELLRVLHLETPIRDLAFSPDDRYLYTANANTTCFMLQIWQSFELR